MNFRRKSTANINRDISLDSFIALPLKLFKLCQLDLRSKTESKSKKRSIVDLLFFSFNLLNIFGYGFSITILLFKQANHLKEFAMCFGFAVTFLIIVVKYCIIFYHQNDIAEIIDALSQKTYTVEEQENFKINQYSRKFHRFSMAFSIFPPIPGFFISMKTLLMFIVKRERKFYPDGYYPFDATQPEIYPIVLLWNFWSLLTMEIINIANCLLLFGTVTFISMEFEVLAMKFRQLKHQQDKSQVLPTILLLIRDHENLLSISARVNQIFSKSFLFSFVTSSFVTCFFAFSASIADKMDKMLFDASFGCVMLFTIFLVCHFGQILKDASLKVADALYDCGWEDLENLKIRLIIAFAIARAQKAAKLSIMDYCEVAMVQFNNVSK